MRLDLGLGLELGRFWGMLDAVGACLLASGVGVLMGAVVVLLPVMAGSGARGWIIVSHWISIKDKMIC